MLTGWTNATGEHEVKLLGFGNLVASGGVSDLVGPAKPPEFFPGIVIELEP